ncbi:hypothetical protein CM49_02984 [Paenibacillus sp. P1XP2]|nr:hypothetical protein CM49_02984 [Paenibacillus sp. P1XP2]
MGSFLQIKIYRGKFIAYTVFVVTLGLALGILTCAILLYQWIENARTEAVSAFARIENELQYDADRIEAYMQRIYSNNRLMTDARYFLGNSAEGYLTNRLKNSHFNEPLVSFPDDMKAFLYSSGRETLRKSASIPRRGAMRFALTAAAMTALRSACRTRMKPFARRSKRDSYTAKSYPTRTRFPARSGSSVS